MDYHGMKRCRFCQIWEYGLSDQGYIISPCKEAQTRPDPNAVCGYFRSGGVLPEIAVDEAMADSFDGGTVEQQVRQRLAWFDRNPEYKTRWPATYTSLLEKRDYWHGRGEPLTEKRMRILLAHSANIITIHSPEANAIAPEIVYVDEVNLGWFERNPPYKEMYPLLYRKLQQDATAIAAMMEYKA